MRIKLIIVAFAVVGYLNVSAQAYVPLLDDLNEWKFTTCFNGCLTDTYYTAGDTLVNGTSYKILDGYHYISRTFLLREDVTEKKVYLKIFLPSGEVNYLLYDFSLEVGDSFEMFNPITPFPEEGGLFDLVAIESLPLADGNEYRHFYFSPSAGNTTSTQDAVWVEGVGSLSIVTAPGGHPDFDGVGQLSCSFRNTERIYENLEQVTECTPSILSVYNTQNPLWNVQFYASESVIRIENANAVQKVMVYAITGNILAEVANITNENQFSMNTSSLSAGLYILKVNDAEGYSKTFKFVVY